MMAILGLVKAGVPTIRGKTPVRSVGAKAFNPARKPIAVLKVF